MMETSSTDRLLTRSAAAWTSKEWASPDFFRMQRQEPRARFSRAPGKLARWVAYRVAAVGAATEAIRDLAPAILRYLRSLYSGVPDQLFTALAASW